MEDLNPTTRATAAVRRAIGVMLCALAAAGCPGTVDSSLWSMASGGGGGGGTGVQACDPTPIFRMKFCFAANCHDAMGTAANFDMATTDWQTRLVGVDPKGGGANPSLCAGQGPYLAAGTLPATGLFMDKVKETTTPACGVLMPQVGTKLTASEFDCVQSWANALVMAGPGATGDGGAGGVHRRRWPVIVAGRSMTRRLAALAVAALLSLPAVARADKRRVGVSKFDGRQEALVRGEVMKALERQGYEPVGADEVAAAATSTAADLDSDDGFKAVAKALGAAAVVTGDVGGKRAIITVRNGADGAVKSAATFIGANPRALAAEVGRTFWQRLGSSVASSKVPSPGKRPRKEPVASDDGPPAAAARIEGEKKKDESGSNNAAGDGVATEGEADRDTDEDRPRSRRRARVSEGADADVAATAEPAASGTARRWLELAIGARGFSRNLTYNDQVSPGLRQYQLALGPAAVLDVAFYPLALMLDGPAANIGLVAAVEHAVGTSSQLAADARFPDGATFPTSMQEFAGGIRYRFPIGAWQVGAAVTGGQHAFWFTSGDGVDRAALNVPNTVYRFARGGLDVRVAVTADFSLAAGAGYRHVLNQAGPIRSDFPHLTVAGVDANVRAAYAVTRGIEARVQADVRRYFYDMHSIAGDAWIAGGAVDQYLSFAVLLAMTLDRDP